MQNTRLRVVLLLTMTIVLGSLLIQPLHGQVLYGSVTGTVTDQSGAGVPKAHIILTNRATSATREADADENGHYLVTDLPPGGYDLKVTASGFKPLTQTNLTVAANTVMNGDAKLQVGAISEQVTVEASTVTLQTEKTDVHTELTAEAVLDMPLNQYRNFQTLINLVPGATPGVFQNAIADTPERALSTNINGTNRNNNNTRVDGAADVFVWLPHHAVYVPPAETIQEVNISTNNFDPEQGMTGGAAVTVITKSGTNQYHGSAFEYFQNQALRAKQLRLAPRGIVISMILAALSAARSRRISSFSLAATMERSSVTAAQRVEACRLSRPTQFATGTSPARERSSMTPLQGTQMVPEGHHFPIKRPSRLTPSP